MLLGVVSASELQALEDHVWPRHSLNLAETKIPGFPLTRSFLSLLTDVVTVFGSVIALLCIVLRRYIVFQIVARLCIFMYSFCHCIAQMNGGQAVILRIVSSSPSASKQRWEASMCTIGIESPSGPQSPGKSKNVSNLYYDLAARS